MTESRVQPDQVQQSVAAAAEVLFGARGEASKFKRIFEHSHVPMVIVDARRRYVEVNLAARLAFRLASASCAP
jgi:hypothetical protein